MRSQGTHRTLATRLAQALTATASSLTAASRWALTLALAIVVMLAGHWAGPVPTAGAASSGQPASPAVLGVNYQPMWASMTDVARARVLEDLAEAGTKWVRVDVAWATFQPTSSAAYDIQGGVAEVDRRIREVRERGMEVLLLFYWAPKWSSGTSSKSGRPGKPTDYADAAAWVAQRYDGVTAGPDLKIDAIEFWNEPDLASFWNPEPAATRVSDFANLVRAAGPAVRAANPALIRVVGAPTYLGLDWYRQFYAQPGIIGSYDALGIHPYQSPADAPPEALDPNWTTYYLAGIDELSQLMTQQGDPARLWATEFGWSSHDNSTFAPAVPNWKRGVSADQQGQFLLRALPVLAANPRLQAAFWYNAWNTHTGDAHEDNFGLTTVEHVRKPAWYAWRCANTGNCSASGGSPERPVPASPQAEPRPPAGAVGPAATLASAHPAQAAAGTAAERVTLIPSGASWRYRDRVRVPARWVRRGFHDAKWPMGPASLGFTDGGAATLTGLPATQLRRGQRSYYFRSNFPAGRSLTDLRLVIWYDDGVVAYLNGHEVYRANASGHLGPKARARRAVPALGRVATVAVPRKWLVRGTNTLAVRVLNRSRSDRDLVFDAQLTAVR